MKTLEKNDWILYRKQVTSDKPGPRARDIQPSKRGDLYNYFVERIWQVVEVDADGTLVARGPKGKVHKLQQNDPRVHRIGWFKRLLLNLAG
ncbi:MAG: hypothetical protein AB3N63_07175 [Puniceicoccaceae bacterium]